VNHSKSCKMVLILKGKGFLTSRLFSSLTKSVRNRTILFFFGWIKDGAAHSSDDGCHSNTPYSQSLSISFRMVSLWTFGIGNAWPWYGSAPFLIRRRQAWCSKHLLRYHQRVAQILWATQVAVFVSWQLDVYSCLSQLLGGLPFYSWHLEFALHG
jgi:hypothetical protein